MTPEEEKLLKIFSEPNSFTKDVLKNHSPPSIRQTVFSLDYTAYNSAKCDCQEYLDKIIQSGKLFHQHLFFTWS